MIDRARDLQSLITGFITASLLNGRTSGIAIEVRLNDASKDIYVTGIHSGVVLRVGITISGEEKS